MAKSLAASSQMCLSQVKRGGPLEIQTESPEVPASPASADVSQVPGFLLAANFTAAAVIERRDQKAERFGNNASRETAAESVRHGKQKSTSPSIHCKRCRSPQRGLQPLMIDLKPVRHNS